MASMVPPPQQPATSGSDVDQRYAKYDERKRKRMMSNRESARRSRMKKQQHLDNLANEVSRMQNENSLLTQRVDQLMQMYVSEVAQKNVLTAQVAELTDRLRSLNTVLEIVAVAHGINLDIPEVPNTSLEPWQLPCPTLPITASADVFNY